MTSILLVLALVCLTQEPADEVGDRFLKTDQVVVHDAGIDDATAESLAEVLAALMTAMVDQFGLEAPLLDVRVEVGDPHNHVLMMPDGKMLLRYEKANLLHPVSLTNATLSRTLGRALVRWHLLRGIATPFGLQDGMIDGFAHYIADESWFQATGNYNVPPEKMAPSVAKYRRLLADIDSAVGRPALSFALVGVSNSHAPGCQLMTVFREALVSAVGEDGIKDVFPSSLAQSELGLTIADKSEPIAQNPMYARSTRRVLNGIPLIAPTGNPTSLADRVAMFDSIWLYVKERYADPSLKAVDWAGAYDLLRSLVPYCSEDVDFFLLVRQLLATLRDPNTRLWSPEAAPFLALPRGMQIDLIENQIVVSDVTAGSEADKLAVKRGMIVSKIDGEDAHARLARIAEFERIYEGLPAERQRLNRAANQILAGAPQETVRVTLLDEQDKTLEVALAREPIQPTGATKSTLESKILPERLGYVKINRFVEGLGPSFSAAVDAMPDVSALIIDVREGQSGPQGARAAAECASKLIQSPTIAGNWEIRNNDNVSRMPQRLIPTEKPFLRPVYLLIDDWCYGTAEVFAVILKTMGRAKLVGLQTAGAHYEPRDMTAPLGQAKIFLSTVAFVPPIPLLVEGYGVPPDFAALKTIADLRTGHDAILAKAVEVATAAR